MLMRNIIVITINDNLLPLNSKEGYGMSPKKKDRLIVWVSAGLDGLFWLVILACVAVVALTATSPWLLGRWESRGLISVPVRIGAGETPQFDVGFAGQSAESIRAAYVDEAQGTLYLETTSLSVVAIANAAKLLTGIGLAYILWLLRAIVKKVKDGEPFAEESGRHLRRLGFGVLAVGLLVPLAQFLASREILHRLPAMSPAINPGPIFDNQVILTSLLILVLAQVWSYGLELQRDRDLTI